jgi:predicted LPLAT superfamily acyltransferase
MLFTVREQGVTRALRAERIEVPGRLPRHDPAVFLPFATRFTRAMEDIVRIYPYQFFNFYNIWLDDHDETRS